MKTFLTVIVILALAVAVIGIGKDLIAKAAIENGVNLVTGLKLSIGSINIGIVKTLVGINNIKLYNPPAFKDRLMMDAPEIYVAYDLPAVLKGKVHLQELRLDLKELTVVKNEKGELNLDALKPVKEQKETPARPAKRAKAPEIQIDMLKLKIGKVIYKDYSKGGEPLVKEFNVNIDEQYRNITDPNALISLIIVKALMNTSIAGMAGFDVSGLKSSVATTLKGAQNVVGDTTQKAVDVTKTAAKSVETTAKDLTNAIFGGKKE